MGVSKNMTPRKLVKRFKAWAEIRAAAIWKNLLTNHLWQRMLKNTLATTIAVILALLPAVVNIYGKAAYLGPITTVFGHPGRRFGMMAEALVLAVSGTLLGIGWSMFGMYLSSLIYDSNPSAAYTIRGVFLVFALMFHGFLRSHTPRLFIMVLLLVIVSVVSLTSTATAVSTNSVTTLLYPILTAAGILLLVNTFVFPEFSSSFLGTTTIETLDETVAALRDAGKYFTSIVEDPEHEDVAESQRGDRVDSGAPTAAETAPKVTKEARSIWRRYLGLFQTARKGDTPIQSNDKPQAFKLKALTDSKAKLRAKLASCKAAQTECNFEIAWAVLPPRDLKPISDTHMKKLVANTIALIGACESKYALMGDESDKQDARGKDEEPIDGAVEAANVQSQNGTSRPGISDDDDDSEADRFETRRKSREYRGRKKRDKSEEKLEREKKDLELVKPKKEIESGDIELLRYLVSHIAKPLAGLQANIDTSVDAVASCLAYCYDVPKLPSGALAPTGIHLEEIDIRVVILTEAMADFDRDSATALETAATWHDLDRPQMDIMPRMETFLISSFLLNTRQAALHALLMLKNARVLVDKRQARHGRKRFYAPRIFNDWRKWLVSGGEEDAFTLPESARKDVRMGKIKDDLQEDDDLIASEENLVGNKDVESARPKRRKPSPAHPARQAKQEGAVRFIRNRPLKMSLSYRLRNALADVLEYLAGSEDVLYALKLTTAVFLVTWPAFIHKWNTWYSLNRGLWAALQLVLITEVAIGTSVMTFALRAVGTTIGCLWGYAAYEARHGDKYVCVVILVIGIIPSTYVQLGSKYIKAGMVSIISMCIVALATEDGTVPGSATENFLKRWIAFLIGGSVALVIEVVLFPVKARDRLVESLAASIRQISEMEACLAYGIETETNVDVHSTEVSARFDRAKGKAQGALTAAETFLPFCANEPRLKGSFRGLALVYAEVLYVLHAVVDRMDNMLHLRHEYGSGVLEELNEKVYPYRRNVAGSITLVLFAVHEALTTKLPLPQFLPSARLAHLRMVNRVREVVLSGDIHEHRQSDRSEIEMTMVKRIVRQKFLSWNAASAGQIEVIEYLEELVDLVKLLVGANEFRSGLLTRPTYREYTSPIDREMEDMEHESFYDRDTRGLHIKPEYNTQDEDSREGRDVMPEPTIEKRTGLKRRRPTFSSDKSPGEGMERTTSEKQEIERQRQAADEELPRSLQRVRSRRIEERLNLQKSWSHEAEAGRKEGKRIGK